MFIARFMLTHSLTIGTAGIWTDSQLMKMLKMLILHLRAFCFILTVVVICDGNRSTHFRALVE